MPFGPRLIGERVVLRPSVSGDVEARRALGRHAEIQRLFGAAEPKTAAMSGDQAAAWVEGLGPDGTVAWIVEAEGSFLGSARLHAFDGSGAARYAVGLLDPGRLGRGFGTETTRLVLDYGFGPLGLQRIEVAVLEVNVRARRCFERCGFRPAGRVTSAAIVDGRPIDELVMQVTRPGRD